MFYFANISPKHDLLLHKWFNQVPQSPQNKISKTSDPIKSIEFPKNIFKFILGTFSDKKNMWYGNLQPLNKIGLETPTVLSTRMSLFSFFQYWTPVELWAQTQMRTLFNAASLEIMTELKTILLIATCNLIANTVPV